jgi:hypothetical protein
MTEFDRGSPAQPAALFDRIPDPPTRADFWFDWGPVFYRGRLDGSARVLGPRAATRAEALGRGRRAPTSARTCCRLEQLLEHPAGDPLVLF